jgi:hypothetical protein
MSSASARLRSVEAGLPSWTPTAAALILLAALLVPIARPYLQAGYQLGHDRHVPFLRVLALEEALAAGQIPPRWFPDFDGGYGSPYPSFYAMLFYYVAAGFHILGLSLGASVELTAFLTMAASGLTMFLLVRHLWGPAAGLLSAGLYVYAPYHLVDAFVRGAYSELTSFIWFPLILLAMLKLADRWSFRWLVIGSLSIAALILTHNIMPMIFLPGLVAIGLALLYFGPQGRKRWAVLWSWARLAVLGALLSAFFWMPIVFDRDLIQTDYFLRVTFHDEFAGLGELLGTTLTYGLTNEIGVPLLVAAVAGLTTSFQAMNTDRQRALLVSLATLAALWLFFVNHRSAWFWMNLPLLPFVQLPWRFLAPVTFVLAVLSGRLLGSKRSVTSRWAIAFLIPLVAIQVHEVLIELPNRMDAEQLNQSQQCADVWGTQDYRPRWSEAASWWSTVAPVPEDGSPVLEPCPSDLVDGHSSSIRLVSEHRGQSQWMLSVAAEAPGIVTLSQFYYPSWNVQMDGEPIESSPSPKTGLLQLAVPSGRYLLSGQLGRTPAQTAGLVVSISTLAASIFWIVSWRLRTARQISGS